LYYLKYQDFSIKY